MSAQLCVMSGECPEICSGSFFAGRGIFHGGGKCPERMFGGLSSVGVQIPMQDYKSLRVAVVIWAHTDTDRQTDSYGSVIL